MTGQEIKSNIEHLNSEIEKLYYPHSFQLCREIMKLEKQIEELQSQCPHEFESGVCIYCHKEENQ